MALSDVSGLLGCCVFLFVVFSWGGGGYTDNSYAMYYLLSKFNSTNKNNLWQERAVQINKLTMYSYRNITYNYKVEKKKARTFFKYFPSQQPRKLQTFPLLALKIKPSKQTNVKPSGTEEASTKDQPVRGWPHLRCLLNPNLHSSICRTPLPMGLFHWPLTTLLFNVSVVIFC